MPAIATTKAAAVLSEPEARTLNALEKVAWDQAAPGCVGTRRNAAGALFGNAGIWKSKATSPAAQETLAALQKAIIAADAGEVTVRDSALPPSGELLQQLNTDAAQRPGQLGIVFGQARVVGKPEIKHCFTVVVAPHPIANRFWVFDTLGNSAAKRNAADDELAAQLVEQSGPSLDAAREIYKNHEKHLQYGIDNLTRRLFPFGAAKSQEISEWFPVWLE